MRIHYMSDIHLEFEPFTPPPTTADVVVLAGDIGVGVKGVEWALDTFPNTPVFMISGNHELYGGAHPKTIEDIRTKRYRTHVSFLEQDVVEIHRPKCHVRFLGATLWTDFALFGADEIDGSMSYARSTMNDYRRIRRSDHWSKITPSYTRGIHLQTRRWLFSELSKPFDGKTVVITHHAPSLLSLSPSHHTAPISSAYASSLERFLADVPCKPDLWIHGHTHRCVDYMIGGTRVVSNQRGYREDGEFVEGWDEGKVVEI
jgi:predicted phosphodiesterase